MFTLSAIKRRITYVVLFETLAIVFSTLLLQAFSHGKASDSLIVAVAVSAIAVAWNFVFNTGFEAAERHFGLRGRSLKTRVIHSLGFEGGLVLFTVPLLMVWYQIGMVEAFIMEAALLLFFLFFTFAFTWAFDQVFTLPGQSQVPGEI